MFYFVWLFLILLNFARFIVGQVVTADGCYYEYPNYGLACAAPFYRQSPVSEAECLGACSANADRCQSVAWSAMQQTCDLFLVAAPKPSKVIYPSNTGGWQGQYGKQQPNYPQQQTWNQQPQPSYPQPQPQPNYPQPQPSYPQPQQPQPSTSYGTQQSSWSGQTNTNQQQISFNGGEQYGSQSSVNTQNQWAPQQTVNTNNWGQQQSHGGFNSPYGGSGSQQPPPQVTYPPVSESYGRKPFDNTPFFHRFLRRHKRAAWNGRLERSFYETQPLAQNFGVQNHGQSQNSQTTGYSSNIQLPPNGGGQYGGGGGTPNYGGSYQPTQVQIFDQFIGSCQVPRLVNIHSWHYFEPVPGCGATNPGNGNGNGYGGTTRSTSATAATIPAQTPTPTTATTTVTDPFEPPITTKPRVTTPTTPRPTTTGTTSCPPVIEDDMALLGFAEHVRNTSTFEECYVACLDAQATFGFECLSGMYFGPGAPDNCILNSENAAAHPDLFVDFVEEPVQYFEPCPLSRQFVLRDQSPIEPDNRGVVHLSHRNLSIRPATKSLILSSSPSSSILLSRTSEWGMWTACPSGALLSFQKRFRNCKSVIPSSCVYERRRCLRR